MTPRFRPRVSLDLMLALAAVVAVVLLAARGSDGGGGIEVESRGGAPVPASTGGASADAIDLNSATAAQLEELPGIGPAYAKDIIDARTTGGPFATPEDLLTRRVVPARVYEGIRDRVVAR